MSRERSTGRRLASLIAIAAALVVSSATAAPSARSAGFAKTASHVSAGRTLASASGAACTSATRTLDGTTVHANWCWNAGQELTSLSWSQSQENPWPQTGYCRWQLKVTGQSAYMWQFSANETLASEWYSGCPTSACWAVFYLKAAVTTGPSATMSMGQTQGPDYGCLVPA